jgi:flavodoxin I
MKSFVIYDSQFGNTKQVAEIIASALYATALPVGSAPASMEGIDLLVVGSPTQGGRPTAKIMAFLDGVPPQALAGTAVAAFDTRLAPSGQSFPLRVLMRIIGFAAPRLTSRMTARGGRLLIPPEGFIVDGREGPLHPGEAERAAAWAVSLAAQLVEVSAAASGA